MARGRPRKSGVMRYTNGRIKPQKKAETAIYWQREREALRLTSRDPYLGTPVGRLFREGRITATHMAAAIRFAEARADADAALGLPPRSPRAQDMNALGGFSNANDDEDAATRKRKAVAAYDKAEEAIGLGSTCLKSAQWVIIYEREPVGHAEFLDLVEALARLMRHYGLRG